MAGLGAFMAAGLASGVGTGLVAQAKLDFEKAKQQAALDARAKERAEDRKFQTERDATNFGQQLKLKDIDNSQANARLDRTEKTQAEREAERRKFEADEKEKDRKARDTETFVDDNGVVQRREGKTTEPVLGPDGNVVKKGLGVGSDTANTYRHRVESAWEAGKGQKDDLGGQEPTNLTKVANRMRTLGIDPRTPSIAAEFEAELESQAAKDKGITDKDAWVQGRLRALGIKDPIAGGEAVPPRMQKPEGGAAAPAPAAPATRSARPIPAAPPAVGEVKRGYRFKGGNPEDPASWEKV